MKRGQPILKKGQRKAKELAPKAQTGAEVGVFPTTVTL
jgi:hypothetical protein